MSTYSYSVMSMSSLLVPGIMSSSRSPEAEIGAIWAETGWTEGAPSPRSASSELGSIPGEILEQNFESKYFWST